MVKKGDMMSIEDNDILAIDLIGVVPDDRILLYQQTVEPAVTEDKSLAGQAYGMLLKELWRRSSSVDSSGQDGFLQRLRNYLIQIRIGKLFCLIIQ